MKRLIVPLLGTLAVTFLVLAAVFSALGQDPDAGVSEPATVPHFDIADTQIEITEEPVRSMGQIPVPVQLEIGMIPDDVSVLTVLTDEDCTPDAEGVSHCLNRVAFETASGTQHAALRHHHNMAEAPCLTPGQTLEVVR